MGRNRSAILQSSMGSQQTAYSAINLTWLYIVGGLAIGAIFLICSVILCVVFCKRPAPINKKKS